MANTGLKPPWKPGQSGNPGGRPKGFARLIRDQTENGQELVQFAIDTFRDPDNKRRWDAFEWLSDRGFGKAAAHALIEDGDPLELSEIDRRIDEFVDELAARREAQAARTPTPGAVATNGTNGAASA